MANLKGKAQTVLGLIEPSQFGPTLAHDHLMIDLRWIFKEPAEVSLKQLAYQKISLSNFGWVNYNWTSNADNCSISEEEVAIAELMRFAGAGGRTLVDPTNIGLGRDPISLARISRATGVNIIMGAGYYLEKTHPSDFSSRTRKSICDEILRDIEVGVGNTGIKAGFIGEIGCSYPMTDNERKSLEASVDAQLKSGAALMVHPGRDPASPFEIVDTVRKAKGRVDRTVICHIDRTCTDRKWLSELAKTGCYIEYDLFGNETSYYCQNPLVDMPSDAQRMEILRWHFSEGTQRKVLISHDIAAKNRLSKYGGLGYDHILTNIVPRMRTRGFSEREIELLLVKNPSKVFTFV